MLCFSFTTTTRRALRDKVQRQTSYNKLQQATTSYNKLQHTARQHTVTHTKTTTTAAKQVFMKSNDISEL